MYLTCSFVLNKFVIVVVVVESGLAFLFFLCLVSLALFFFLCVSLCLFNSMFFLFDSFHFISFSFSCVASHCVNYPRPIS